MLILTSRLFDPEYTYPAKCLLTDRTLVVDVPTGLIADVRATTADDLALLENQGEKACDGEEMLDLRGLTVLPGLVDAHVHFFMHSWKEASWTDQVTKEPLAERTIRAVNHARATLMAGYTTVRDLGTEGAEDADLSIRKCIALGLIPGPRYFCVTRAIVSTGSYGPKTERRPSTNDVDGAVGAEAADGPDECRKAVRRQVGAGADWIKIYADYSFRARLLHVDLYKAESNFPLFLPDELSTLITTAHSLGVKVAAHASMATSIKTVADLGVDSVEHGPEGDLAGLQAMAKNGTTWVPTLSVFYLTNLHGRWERLQALFRAGMKVKGLKIAAGGDTGVMAHGENALELKLMHESGMPWQAVLRSATKVSGELVVGPEWAEGSQGRAEKLAELVKLARSTEEGKESRRPGQNAVPLGLLKAGYAADLIAIAAGEKELETDFAREIRGEKVRWVVKGGKVYKRDGVPVLS